MKRGAWHLLMFVVASVMFIATPAALAQDAQQPAEAPDAPPALDVNWQRGPLVGNIGANAEINLPPDYVLAGPADTRKIMESLENPVSGAELAFIGAPAGDWFVVFEFAETGYVKDDEKSSLDADKMLEAFKKGTEAGNKERRKRGWQTLDIVGWHVPPRYNAETNNLEWAIRARSLDGDVVNYNTRLLGRRGVMSVTLVADPERIDEILPDYAALIGGFSYKPGAKYAEFRAGDAVAKYGLSALVVGGTAALAAKTGILKGLWKIIVVALAAFAGLFKKIFGRRGKSAGPHNPMVTPEEPKPGE